MKQHLWSEMRVSGKNLLGQSVRSISRQKVVAWIKSRTGGKEGTWAEVT